MVDPPSVDGCFHETCDVPLPALAMTFNGLDGTVAGVLFSEAIDDAEVPDASTAVTVNE